MKRIFNGFFSGFIRERDSLDHKLSSKGIENYISCVGDIYSPNESLSQCKMIGYT
ncbi:hypothetical protein YC2023_050466 [Brassica napus]